MSTASANGHNGASPDGLSIQEAAERVGVAVTTLRRWARDGLLPRYDGSWSRAVVSHAKIVARLRDRGHSLKEIRRATDEGRLAYGYIEELFDTGADVYTLAEASRETGLEPALIARVLSALGTAPAEVERISEEDVALLRYVAAVLEAGLPLVALLQLVRVYGQAMARLADAEVRLFHMHVHEPLMRSRATGLETADEMLELTRRLLPLASPVMDHVHQRYLQHFLEQDVVGHMETDLEGDSVDLGRMRVAIAFADLTGYTRLTEEAGELEAVDAVERFVDAVQRTLPDDGRDVNIASRVGARAAGAEVLVTRPVVEQARDGLEFDRIADVRLKGFNESTEIFIAREREAA
jgi:adenylate cyclase